MNKVNYKFIYFLALMLILSVSSIAGADSGKVSGLGHDFVTLNGTDALSVNPALSNVVDNAFIIELGLNAGVWNNGMNSQYFNQHLDSNIKNEIMDNVGANGLVLSGKGSQNLKMIIGSIGLSGGVQESMQMVVSPDLVDLILNGNELDRTYKFEGTSGAAAVYANPGISYSHSIKTLAEQFDVQEFYLGGTVRYLTGAFAKIDGEGEATFELDGGAGVSSDGVLKAEYAEEASGYSFDLGGYARINDKWSVGGSILNIGSLTSSSARYYEYQYTADESGGELEEIEDSPLGENLTYKLPLMIKAGAEYRWIDEIDIYGDYALTAYNTGVNDHQFAVGTEIKYISFLPFRLGAKYSTLQKDFNFSAGLGLNTKYFNLDIGVSDLKAAFNNSKAVDIGANISLAF